MRRQSVKPFTEPAELEGRRFTCLLLLESNSGVHWILVIVKHVSTLHFIEFILNGRRPIGLDFSVFDVVHLILLRWHNPSRLKLHILRRNQITDILKQMDFIISLDIEAIFDLLSFRSLVLFIGSMGTAFWAVADHGIFVTLLRLLLR